MPTPFAHSHPHTCGGKEQGQRTNYKRIKNQIKISSPFAWEKGMTKENELKIEDVNDLNNTNDRYNDKKRF